MKFREFFDRYGWAVGVAIAALGFFRVLYGREPFCGSDGEHCAREWASALSGWIAAAVAFPTLLSLQRQISEANRHQQENIEINLMPTFALALRVRELVMRQTGLIIGLKRNLRRGDKLGRSPHERRELGETARVIATSLLGSPDLINFNTTVAGELSGNRYWIEREVAHLHDLLIRYDQDVRSKPDDDEFFRTEYRVFIHDSVDTVLENLEPYLLDRDEQARLFLLRWNQPAREPYKFPDPPPVPHSQ
ncbi:hypothetical protein [Ensifer sp. B1-9]|uniref:hypothetical protein n=1 Tax=Ensifer sp. B1-9 TaxID=3141455 RepID=UPI003D207462